MSQWSVVRQLLSTMDHPQKVHVVAGLAVREQEKRLSSNIIWHDLFSAGKNDKKSSHYPWRYLKRELDYQLYKTYREMFAARLRYYKDILSASRTDIVVVGEDGISGEIWLVRAAKKAGIPVFILPYEASGKEDFINLLRSKKRENNLVVHNDRQRSFLEGIGESKWTIDFEGDSVSVYPLEYITALHDMRFRIQSPWTTHGGEADILLSESAGMTEFYGEEGIPPQKLRQTGSPYDDAVFSKLKISEHERAYENCGKISPEGTSILVSLPPDYDSERSHVSDFESYAEMCRVMQSAFGERVAKLTIMVHPAYHSQHHDRQTGNVEIEFSKDWVLHAIPAHDVYLTCGSSTLRWAVGARKAAINFDFYKFRLNFFDRLPGLKQFEDSDACFGFVRKMTEDDTFYSSHIRANAPLAEKWTYLDGQCHARISAALREVA